MAPVKTVAVTITMADPHGGVNYIPRAGEPGVVLNHGETHELPLGFARSLIHSKRAVLVDPDAVLDTGPLTTDALNSDPSPASDPTIRRRGNK
jgi:hypothetical protein